MNAIKLAVRYLMRRRFFKALDKADWRTATLRGGGAEQAVEELRPKLRVAPRDYIQHR